MCSEPGSWRRLSFAWCRLGPQSVLADSVVTRMTNVLGSEYVTRVWCGWRICS